MQQIKHIWTWTCGIERGVCFCVWVCLTVLVGMLGTTISLLLHSKNRVKLAAVQLFLQLQCQMWSLALTCTKSWNVTSWAITRCALSHCAVEDYVNFPSSRVFLNNVFGSRQSYTFTTVCNMEPVGLTWGMIITGDKLRITWKNDYRNITDASIQEGMRDWIIWVWQLCESYIVAIHDDGNWSLSLVLQIVINWSIGWIEFLTCWWW